MVSSQPNDAGRPRQRGYRAIQGQGSIHAGLYWGHQVLGLSMGMAVPAVIGWGLDEWLGTDPWLTVIGAVLGFAVLMLRLVQMVSADAPGAMPAASAAADGLRPGESTATNVDAETGVETDVAADAAESTPRPGSPRPGSPHSGSDA